MDEKGPSFRIQTLCLGRPTKTADNLFVRAPCGAIRKHYYNLSGIIFHLHQISLGFPSELLDLFREEVPDRASKSSAKMDVLYIKMRKAEITHILIEVSPTHNFAKR